MILLPRPRSLSVSNTSVAIPAEAGIRMPMLGEASLEPVMERLTGTWMRLTDCSFRFVESGDAWLRCELSDALNGEAYRLQIGPSGTDIHAGSRSGLLHGLHSLHQLILQSSGAVLPQLDLHDYPACSERGYLLDISRDKVPTMTSLRALVEELAALKFNQLQLYTEHSFAYEGHELVWGSASPLTRDEILNLDSYCALHGIELVPCINTFGHWERWLRHPEYRHLAECPFGWMRPDGHGMPWGSTLRPGPEALALLRELMDQYLPLFRSRRVNIGGDEPWELGMGLSRTRCEEEGRHRVYLQFLQQIIEAASTHKDVVQFWSDIVLENPESWEAMPSGSRALIWGYEAGHPFSSQAEVFRKRKVPHLLCPGSSTWNSLGARLGNALQNIREAGSVAASSGSAGMLLTDWGDFGHHQASLLSTPALHAFAQSAWNPHDTAPPLEASLNLLSFQEDSPRLAPLLLELGQLHTVFRHRPPNRFPLVQVLSTPQSQLPIVTAELADEELAEAHERLCGWEEAGDAIHCHRPDGDLLRREFRLTVSLLRHACERTLGTRNLGGGSHNRSLRADFVHLIGEFEELWVARNRIGGLHESSGRFRRALQSYPSKPPLRPAWPPPPPLHA